MWKWKGLYAHTSVQYCNTSRSSRIPFIIYYCIIQQFILSSKIVFNYARHFVIKCSIGVVTAHSNDQSVSWSSENCLIAVSASRNILDLAPTNPRTGMSSGDSQENRDDLSHKLQSPTSRHNRSHMYAYMVIGLLTTLRYSYVCRYILHRNIIMFSGST